MNTLWYIHKMNYNTAVEMKDLGLYVSKCINFKTYNIE